MWVCGAFAACFFAHGSPFTMAVPIVVVFASFCLQLQSRVSALVAAQTSCNILQGKGVWGSDGRTDCDRVTPIFMYLDHCFIRCSRTRAATRHGWCQRKCPSSRCACGARAQVGGRAPVTLAAGVVITIRAVAAAGSRSVASSMFCADLCTLLGLQCGPHSARCGIVTRPPLVASNCEFPRVPTHTRARMHTYNHAPHPFHSQIWCVRCGAVESLELCR
jgi:hypothetical protein